MPKINIEMLSESQKKFVEKYGLEYIERLDDETGGIFTHEIWNGSNTYLDVFAKTDERIGYYVSKNFGYENFEQRIYNILIVARKDRGILTSGDYEGYDFVQGEFRKKYADIFIDGLENFVKKEDLENIKRGFYFGSLEPKWFQLYPQLVESLKDKNLVFMKDNDFDKRIIIGYLSSKLGNKNFLSLCSDYGNLLYSLENIPNIENMSFDEYRRVLDEEIHSLIVNNEIRYNDLLPDRMKKAYPEIFLPDSISKELREKYYQCTLQLNDLRDNPELVDALKDKNINRIYGINFGKSTLYNFAYDICNYFKVEEILELGKKYGKYLQINILDNKLLDANLSFEEKESYLKVLIERAILHRKLEYGEDAPDFFKDKHPELVISVDAPELLKKYFYGNIDYNAKQMTFTLLSEHKEWEEFLVEKNITRLFPLGNRYGWYGYESLFGILGPDTSIKLGKKNPEIVDRMVKERRVDTLKTWYNATSGKFIPHHVVMLNFPEGEIDKFLSNGRKWSKLARINKNNLNDDGKAAILKAAYTMGVFDGSDEGFNKVMDMFTGIPNELSEEEHYELEWTIDNWLYNANVEGAEERIENYRSLLEKAYIRNDSGKYILNLDKKDKETKEKLREFMELAEYPHTILTQNDAHQLFGAFSMEYNPEFAKFFEANFEEIMAPPGNFKEIASIQRQFKDILRENAARRITMQVAIDFVKNNVFENVEVGNEGVANVAKIAGYSQNDFEEIQRLFDEGKTREFSSIPRIQGSEKGYTYEILRLDDPLALTIGTMTDCCQEVNNAGQTSMEHSVVSEDGRVFCVRDEEGRIVAQSWVWRNKDVICFDNIEIPDRIFELYKREHEEEKTGLADRSFRSI